MPLPTAAAVLKTHLPRLGHRNWIGVVDGAYPAQVSAGVVLVPVADQQLAAIASVVKAVRAAPHVRGVAFLDAELDHVAELHAKGVTAYRAGLAKVLGDADVQRRAHEDIIADLDQAGKIFSVLLLKTSLAIPYTSLFMRLECGYWSDAGERALRQAMA